MTKPLDVAFEKYRQKKYGAHPYPVDDYTMFGIGWKAGVEAAAVIVATERGDKHETAARAKSVRQLAE